MTIKFWEPVANFQFDVSTEAIRPVRPVQPPHPGAVLRQVLERFGITQEELSAAIQRSRILVNKVINGRADITPCLAIRLSRALYTSPDIWMNLQNSYDMFKARDRLRGKLDRIKPLR